MQYSLLKTHIADIWFKSGQLHYKQKRRIKLYTQVELSAGCFF